jgi:hypothetical protein
MKRINKTVDNGIVRINDITFLQFSNAFRGRIICSKKNGMVVSKFILFWRGLTVPEVKNNFDFKQRVNDN